MGFLKNLFGTNPKVNLAGLFENWLTKVNINSTPGQEITAINFGIFQSEAGYMVYITGSKEYDSNDDDWATEIDYEPSQSLKYLPIPLSLTEGLEWIEVQNLVESTLKTIIAQNQEFMIFKGKVVTTGFDDGSLTRIK